MKTSLHFTLGSASLIASFTLLMNAGAPYTAHAIPAEVSRLVLHETRFNAASVRLSDPVALEHFEIPLELIEKDVAYRTPKLVRDSLIFERDGKKFVRWIINPEDTRWANEVEKWLRIMGVEPVRYKHFIGYRTASRSYIVEDPVNKAVFSAKVSTNNTGGLWKNKKQYWSDATQIRQMADFYREQAKRLPPNTLVVLDEPAAFGIKDLDQGMVIRLLNELPGSNHLYVPGFSVLQEQLGREIAERHGSNDPVEFWNEHYNKPLARALAELWSLTGINLDSPHSQNFLVELDETMKPTGRIIVRDLGDSYLIKDFFTATNRMRVYNNWEEDNKRDAAIPMAVGTLHGNSFPSWMSQAAYEKWGKDFFDEFNRELSLLTGVPKNELGAVDPVRKGDYFMRNYDAKSPTFAKYFSTLRDAPNSIRAARCENVFKGIAD